MDIIDDVLSNIDHQPKRSNREDIFLLPQVQFLAHEDNGNHLHVVGAEYPEYVQPSEEQFRFKTQSSRGNPLLQDKDFEVPATICSSDYVEWLEEKAASFMTTKNKNLTCKLLVKLAGDLKSLPPGIDLSSCDLHRLVMKRSWWMDFLILEMRTVEENVCSEVRDSGIFVLTSHPYSTLLRELAEAVMKNGPQLNLLFQDGQKELPINLSSNEYVEWLEINSSFIGKIITLSQPALPDHTARNKIQSAFRILMKLAEDLKYLQPGDASHLGYDIKMASWRVYWNELIAEMKTVEASCSLEIRYSGIYVLTTWPYREFLLMLAGKLAECLTW
ncbi:hypothetical protein KC19_4G214300 [Ceratodon purpureus]|uniref:Uncharacterized protein n=1 Tax=Ceratodon purpureus TaxID=3225 RepID=A0A8T0IB67_CERPU|nr:hypothetical protein KC19_4G214300 [Ceratodon purpureus]